MNNCLASSSTGPNGPDASKNWFAVFTIPRHEKTVEAHFHLREIENFLPLYRRERRWKDGSKGMVQLPLFSSYIFVRIGSAERVPVLRVPGVRSIVGCGPQPLAISAPYIHWLRDGLRHGKIEPHPYLTAGAKVRLRAGAMEGMEGVLVRKKNNFRVVLTVEMIMRSVTVEVKLEDIEPVSRTSYAAEYADDFQVGAAGRA